MDSKSQTILDAATQVFLTHGYSAATTDMIQREAGVSKATLYTAFGGKEALFGAVIERQCATLGQAVLAVEPASEDLEKTLNELARAYLDIVLSPNGLALFRVVVGEAPRFPALARMFYVRGPRAMVEAVQSRLASAAEAGTLDVQSVGLAAAAQIFVGLVRSEAQRDIWVQWAVQTFLRAFARDQASSTTKPARRRPSARKV
jgi:AcrR family transcriptional regulator